MSHSDLKTALDRASQSSAASLTTDTFRSLTDAVIENTFSNLNQLINGHATAVWLPEQRESETVLTIAYNVGARGHEIEGVISQSLDKGLVSKSYQEGETICHQGFFKHREQSSTVDQELGQITAHQIAAPFALFGQTIGAITIIQTLASGLEQQSEWGFDEDDVSMFQSGVEAIQRLFELNVIRGLE